MYQNVSSASNNIHIYFKKFLGLRKLYGDLLATCFFFKYIYICLDNEQKKEFYINASFDGILSRCRNLINCLWFMRV